MSLAFAVLLLSLSASTETSTTSSTGSKAVVRYELIDEPGALTVLTKPASVLGFMAHEHVVEARGYRGYVLFDASMPEKCTIEVQVPVAKLVVDRVELRKRLQLKKDVSEKDRRKVTKNMRAEKQLHVSKYPDIRFEANHCESMGSEGKFMVDGLLEIRGHRHKLRVPIEAQFLGEELKIRSEFSEVHESFGFKPYSAFGGMIKNDKNLRFRVRLRARKAELTPKVHP